MQSGKGIVAKNMDKENLGRRDPGEIGISTFKTLEDHFKTLENRA